MPELAQDVFSDLAAVHRVRFGTCVVIRDSVVPTMFALVDATPDWLSTREIAQYCGEEGLHKFSATVRAYERHGYAALKIEGVTRMTQALPSMLSLADGYNAAMLQVLGECLPTMHRGEIRRRAWRQLAAGFGIEAADLEPELTARIREQAGLPIQSLRYRALGGLASTLGVHTAVTTRLDTLLRLARPR